MGAFDLIRKGAKGVKNSPFFSKADVVLDELQRNKGTGNEFLTEIIKKGAKPTELKERGIEKALKDKPKMTKAEVQKVFEEKAPPRVQEKVLTDVPDYDDWLEAKAQEEYGVDYFDLNKDEKKKLDKMYGDLPATQYDRYKTPGGENYREILLKLPAFDSKRIMELEADIRRSEGAYKYPMSMPDFRAKVEELAQLKEQQSAAGTPYVSSHYKTDPNLLAHIRVQDFQAPSRGFAVINTRSGNRSEVFPSMEQAQAYLAQMPENMQGMLRIDEAAGKPKKVLLVDEIQSDWHQEGRKKGYKQELSDEEKNRLSEVVFNAPNWASNPDMLADFHRLNAKAKAAEKGVPDAPFKKNWHELAMKRVLDYAAENGYDSVAITPGAEQAKRYDLSKQIGAIEYSKSGDDNYKIKVFDPVGQPMSMNIPNTLDASGLEQYVGKEMAEKIASQATREQQSLSGLDLQVGGEGMKGFYDKILPDYLNNYGKKYGAQTGEIQLQTGQEMGRGPNGSDMIPSYSPTMQSFHSFDITPQMREEITTKGQPMYGKVAMPVLEGLAAGTGAATIAPEIFDTNNEQQVQNPVHFTENPDAMLLELMQRN